MVTDYSWLKKSEKNFYRLKSSHIQLPFISEVEYDMEVAS